MSATVSVGAQRGPQTQLTTPPPPPGGGGGGGGGTAGGGGTPINAQARQMFQMMTSYLTDLGLGSLASVNAQGNPTGWLWQQIMAGVDTADELVMAIEQTDVWKDRFSVIVAQRERAAQGLPGQVMTVSEVLAYERQAEAVLRNAGLPKWFYDEPGDIGKYILAGFSVAEMSERLGGAWDRVRETDPLVRDAFEDYYGIGNGDAAMAAFFLDPERTLASIEKASRTAYTAGFGQRYGINMDRATAERIASTSRTEQGIDEGLRQVASMDRVFQTGFTERDQLTAETTGVGAVFDGSGEAQRDIERRVAGRRRNDQSSLGGAAITREGLTGVRTAT